MKRKPLIIAAVALALLLLGAGAWAYLVPRENPQLAKVRELQQKTFAGNPFDNSVPPEQRRQQFEELRREADKLSPEERDKLMRENPPPFVKRMQQDIASYFELPAEKRKAELDKHIDRFEQMRRGMEQRMAQNGGRPGGPGGFGPRPGGPGGRNMDPAARANFAKRMLDNTSPDQRAQMGEFMRQVQDRRRERGLPSMPRPRF